MTLNGISLRFWGVRGSLPTPGPSTMRYGGNTLCVEVRCGPHLLILDAGSGMRGLGGALLATDQPVAADLLLSHTHFDHICGLPFFRPLFDPQARLRIWGGHLAPASIADPVLASLREPFMPSLDQAARAALTFHDFAPGEVLAPHPGLAVGTMALAHPGNAVGYRIAWGGHSICYITDTEHPASGLDADLRTFVAGTDILIYDARYTDEEYESRVGWGHSTWRMAARLAEAAAVGQLVLFHHDPDHDDDAMDAIAEAAAARFKATIAAREGLCLVVPERTTASR